MHDLVVSSVFAMPCNYQDCLAQGRLGGSAGGVPALAFSSGLDLAVVGSSPTLVPCFRFFLPLPCPPPFPFSPWLECTLSKIIDKSFLKTVYLCLLFSKSRGNEGMHYSCRFSHERRSTAKTWVRLWVDMWVWDAGQSVHVGNITEISRDSFITITLSCVYNLVAE